MKRKDILDYLRKYYDSIYLLQETHIKAQSENCLRSAWGMSMLLEMKQTEVEWPFFLITILNIRYLRWFEM